jgi:hypothetical protein
VMVRTSGLPSWLARMGRPRWAALALCGLLSACGSPYQPMPRGIGGHPSDLKASPCACIEIPLRGDPLGRERFVDVLRSAMES